MKTMTLKLLNQLKLLKIPIQFYPFPLQASIQIHILEMILILQQILNMIDKSDESELLISFIRLINDNKLKQASKVKASFKHKKYQMDLFLFLERYFSSNEMVQSIEKLNKQITKKDKKIKDLENDFINLKKTKGEKISQLTEKILQEVEIFKHLMNGNLLQVSRLAQKYKVIEIKAIVQDLIQYRWFKDSITNKRKQDLKKIQEQLTSKQSRHLKHYFLPNKDFRQQVNMAFSKALKNIYSASQNEIKLPEKYFENDTQQWLQQIHHDYYSLKEIMRENEIEYHKQVLTAIKLINPSISSSCESKSIYDLLNQLIELVNKKRSSFNSIQRNPQPTRQQPSKSNSIQNLATFINNLIELNQISNFEDKIRDVTNSGIYNCFHSLVERLKAQIQMKETHKQFMAEHTKCENEAFSMITRMNQEVKTKLISEHEIETPRQSLTEVAMVLQSNLKKLFEEYQFTPKCPNQPSKVQQKEENYPRINSSIDNSETTQQLHQISEPKIEQNLSDELELYKKVNGELCSRNEQLKRDIEQAYQIAESHRRQNQDLMLKIKICSKIQASVINTPFFDQSTSVGKLQEEKLALHEEVLKLKTEINEKESSIHILQARVKQTISRLNIQREEEVNKWREKYRNSNREIDDLNEQIMQLNTILQEKYYPTANSEIEVNEQYKQVQDNELRQNQQEKIVSSRWAENTKNVFKSVSQASMILGNFNVENGNEHLEQIQKLESVIDELKHLAMEKDKEFLQIKIRQKRQFDERIQQITKQKTELLSRIREYQGRIVSQSPENIKNLHLFPSGFIFQDYDQEQRQFLLQKLINYIGPIRRTRLLFRADNYNRTNFHKYIDKEKHIVVIFKTVYGKLIAGYSEQAFDSNGSKRGYGMILSLWARKVFQNKDRRAITYDDYFGIFGNSELRIKSMEYKLFSNFGIANGYYDNQGERVNVILGEDKEREVDLAQYEFYALDPEY